MKRMSLLLIRKPVEGQVGSAERAEHAASPDAGPAPFGRSVSRRCAPALDITTVEAG
jgi:hypothetical protein